jgi:hypothetical protein
MQLQQVATTRTCRTNTLLVVKSIGLNISRIIVAKIWSKWTTFLLVFDTIDSQGRLAQDGNILFFTRQSNIVEHVLGVL